MRQTKLTAKDCSEQFYTDLRWSMSAWLLRVHPIADLPSLKRIGISHLEYDTMNIFYIIGVVVVIIVVAGFLGLRV
jgi:hypothetical protein